MLDRIISYSFYFLFLLTPLFWSSSNYELFEFNKMILVYGFTVVIVGCWLLKIINHKSLIINRTPLDIPLLLFLGANILSTIFSMDVHTSIWGYYSRSNGGLLSLISYLLLYWAFVSNMDLDKIKTTLKFGLASGFIISIWAIMEHFGVSPSCVILRGEFNASCWIQDVQARVFATLGQPNWLAAYLAMLIFPAMYFLLKARNRSSFIILYSLITVMYLAFTFTYSRGPTLGLIGGMVVFLVLNSIQKYSERLRKPENQNTRTPDNLKFRSSDSSINPVLRVILSHSGIVILSFLIINLLFGSALTSFRLVSKFAAPVRPGISLPAAPASGKQLENGGTESGQIRFIVWKGALDIFKNNPVFGSGLETFAYSYYQYRPVKHNLTSEWDFLYNKAHNEYLNYLATTGIVGFLSYSIMIITVIIVILKKQNANRLLLISLLAAYISYLIYNFFLFSVVIIAVFFYLFPAIAFVATGAVREFVLIKKLPSFLYPKILVPVVIIFTLYILYSISQLWKADTLFARGQRASETGNPGRAYNLLAEAVNINKGEPFYKSELAYAAAQAAASLIDSDATLSAALKDEAIAQTEMASKSSPKNLSYIRTAVRTYFELASIDDSYINKTLNLLDQAIKLAPTDPKLYYNKALVLQVMNKENESVKALKEALELKPNYPEAAALLKESTSSAKE